MNNVLKFEFSQEEAGIILKGLGELPAKESLGVISKIQNQAKAQLDVAKNEVLDKKAE